MRSGSPADLRAVDPPQALDLAIDLALGGVGAEVVARDAPQRVARAHGGLSPPADRLIVDEDARPAFELVAVRVASLASSACVGWPPLPMT